MSLNDTSRANGRAAVMDPLQQHFSFSHHYRNSTYLQILARISPLPVAKRLPLGLGATEITMVMLANIARKKKRKEKERWVRGI